MGAVNSTYQLHIAASDGNIEQMKNLVEHGALIESAYVKARTPLLQCFYSSLIPKERRLAMAMYLISIGANVNAADHRGWTPLHYSADRGDIQAVQLLLNNGAKTWTRDSFGRTPACLTQNDAEGHACFRLIKAAGDKEGKPFPFSLETPLAVAEGATVLVRFTSTPNHSLYDYIQLYYTVLGSWTMTARIGSFQYVPEGASGEVEISLKGMELNYPLRALYFSYESQKFVAASLEFTVIPADQLPPLSQDPLRKASGNSSLVPSPTEPAPLLRSGSGERLQEPLQKGGSELEGRQGEEGKPEEKQDQTEEEREEEREEETKDEAKDEAKEETKDEAKEEKKEEKKEESKEKQERQDVPRSPRSPRSPAIGEEPEDAI